MTPPPPIDWVGVQYHHLTLGRSSVYLPKLQSDQKTLSVEGFFLYIQNSQSSRMRAVSQWFFSINQAELRQTGVNQANNYSINLKP